MAPAPRPHLRSFAGLALALAGFGGSAAALQLPDPYAPHRRWVEAPDPLEPWLPRSVAFAAAGELVLGAGSIGAPRALLCASPDLLGNQLVGELELTGAIGTVQVAAGGASELFALSLHPSGAPGSHVPRVTRLGTGAGQLGSSWSTDLAPGQGAARLALSTDGATLLIGSDATGGAGGVLLDWLDPASGATRAHLSIPGGGLRGLALSDDGSRAVVLAGNELCVLDGAGTLLFAETLGLVTNALALAGDGSALAVGDGADLRLLAATATGAYVDALRIAGAPGELVVCAALDRAGARVALGSWEVASGQRARFRVVDAGGALLHELAQLPGALGLQNYPEAVAITPDGRRAAYAAWGVGDAQPELVLVDVETATTVLAVDVPGSARALALADDGTRLAAGVKHVHANQLGSTGELVLHDTGERQLQLLARSAPGGGLALSSKRAGASRALFCLGRPLASPVPFRGAGSLWLDRGGPLVVRSQAADGTGRADLWLDLKALGQVLGGGFAVQAAWRAGGATLLGPLLLPIVL